MKIWIVLYVEPAPNTREIYHVCTSYGLACYLQEQEARRVWGGNVTLLTEDEDGEPLRRWVSGRGRSSYGADYSGDRLYKANGFEVAEYVALTD